MREMAKPDIYYIAVLGKALNILDAFVELPEPWLSLQELSRRTKLNKNAVFRVLYTLAEHGYVCKRGHLYELGPKVLDLGDAKLRRKDFLAVTGPVMEALRDRFRETVNLAMLDDAQIRYVDVRESPERFRLAERIGGSDFLHCTALGKCLLAWTPAEDVRRLLKRQGMPRQTECTITTLAAFEAELERVRKEGYAVDRAESMAGAFCVAVPILDRQQAPVAALSIAGPSTRFNENRLAEASRALLGAAAEIRARLGHR
jgi:DNA-binding IclR family transcriptional regulator